jgi:hypothetical protein
MPTSRCTVVSAIALRWWLPRKSIVWRLLAEVADGNGAGAGPGNLQLRWTSQATTLAPQPMPAANQSGPFPLAQAYRASNV